MITRKSKKPVTPNAKVVKPGSHSSGKKQQTLMSFFKPMKPSKEINKLAEDPTGQQKEYNDVADEADTSIATSETGNTSPLSHTKQDKLRAFNDEGNSEPFTDTPLTSESDVVVPPTSVSETNTKKSFPHSSPVRMEEDDKEEHDYSKTDVSSGSPQFKRRAKARKIVYAESDDEDEGPIPGNKRRKVVESEDEDDFEPEGEVEGEESDDMSDFIVDDDADDIKTESEAEIVGEDEELLETKTKPSNKKRSPENKSPKHASQATQNTSDSPKISGIGSKFTAGSSYHASIPSSKASKPSSTAAASTEKRNFNKENEERYQWLVVIRDGEKRTQDDPEYDSRTLFIPQSAWSKFTPFEKQYWEIKSKMWDTVVFFKKGKFYELYENDAIIANTEFDLKLAGGGRANMKLAGIPEMSFDYWAKEFINHGYKVAKVDQKESLLAKEMRGGTTKEEKIIKRELSSVLTGGTLTDLNMITDEMAIYCLAIKEEEMEDGSKLFGVSFVDTATSELNLIEFNDDSECTKLETLVTQIRPKEVLCEKGNLCQTAAKILKYSAHATNQIWNTLNPITDFWDYELTLENLVKSKYYPANDLDDYSNYPSILVEFKDNHKTAFTAFGGLLNYLKSLKLDESIMTLKNIKEYNVAKTSAQHLILDGITLNNLEILNNSFDGSDRGTLLKLLNRAMTSFGKRMLKDWVIHPLMDVSKIEDRLNSVDYLLNDGLEFRSIIENGLTGLPDLERLLARIHSKNLRFKDFLKVVESFEKISNLVRRLAGFSSEDSGALHTLMNSFPGNLQQMVADWEDAFDRQQALHDVIVPAAGVDEEFDESKGKMDQLEKKLEENLRKYKSQYKSHEICYKDSGKEIYLIEVPNKLVKNIPHDWQQMGSTSKVKRYWSPEVKKLVRELLEQRELHKMVCDTLRNRMYEKFDANYESWMICIKVLSKIDCILSLAKTSETLGAPSCRPVFVESEKGFLEFRELRHPCFIGAKDFIPNDVCLGGEEASFGLLTGANAAGKSTIMRTTALAVILAQVGCYIPATSAELSVVDRIMTRLGANDNILQGKSTFFVELSETKKILSNATSKSLVILDELGRGGSSSDGHAIAESVLYHLATHVQSLGFFATHYGSLGLSFKMHPRIKQLRMAIVIDENSRNITFLYKLEKGTAPGSFGMNVASMCGISNEIVENAEIAAREYEQTSKLKKAHENDTAKIGLGLQSDFSWYVNGKMGELTKDILDYNEGIRKHALCNVFDMIDSS